MIASPEIPCANSVTGIPKQRRSARNSVSRKTLIGYRDAGGKASTPLWICKPFILCYLYLSQGSKALQILGHELELAFLFQAIVQGFLKRLKSEIALRLKEFIGQLLLLFVEIGQVVDSQSPTHAMDTRGESITINQDLSLTTSSLATGTVGQSYSITFMAANGVPPGYFSMCARLDLAGSGGESGTGRRRVRPRE